LQVRDALATLVATAASLTVHKNLDYAILDENLPCAAIQSGNDEADDAAGTLMNNSREGGSARFAVNVLVAASDDPEGAADVFEALIRAAVLSNLTLSGKATQVRYLGGEWEFDLGDCAIRRLIFQATF
jgi:predicted oxidoreductase